MADSMRLDRFLWWARLTKKREQAQELAEGGHLRIDGRRIDRAHAPVRVGSVIAFWRGGRVRIVRVKALPARRGPAPEAAALYTDLANDSQAGGEALTTAERGHSEAADPPEERLP